MVGDEFGKTHVGKVDGASDATTTTAAVADEISLKSSSSLLFRAVAKYRVGVFVIIILVGVFDGSDEE